MPISLPEFPKNLMGLRRGTVLRSTSELTMQIGVPIGERIVIGYDGKYIRCMAFTWSIDKIQNEILDGIWEVAGYIDLSDEERSRKFAKEIEMMDV